MVDLPMNFGRIRETPRMRIDTDQHRAYAKGGEKRKFHSLLKVEFLFIQTIHSNKSLDSLRGNKWSITVSSRRSEIHPSIRIGRWIRVANLNQSAIRAIRSSTFIRSRKKSMWDPFRVSNVKKNKRADDAVVSSRKTTWISTKQVLGEKMEWKKPYNSATRLLIRKEGRKDT